MAGEIAFLSFDAVAHALAFSEQNRHIMANFSMSIPALQGGLNETMILDFAKYNFILDFVTIFQVLLQTFCLLILTNESEKLKMNLWSKRMTILLLSYMFVCNIAIWASCSFIEVDYSDGNVSLYVVNELVLGERDWKFVSTFLYPLVLFYRFHSAKLILTSIIPVRSAEII